MSVTPQFTPKGTQVPPHTPARFDTTSLTTDFTHERNQHVTAWIDANSQSPYTYEVITVEVSGNLIGPNVALTQPDHIESDEWEPGLFYSVLWAQHAAMVGDHDTLIAIGTADLGLRRRSDRWTEALSTAALRDWLKTESGEYLDPATAVQALRREMFTVHRQLVPLWRRRTYGGRRMWMLEHSFAEGVTLRDVLADTADPADPLFDVIPADRRLASILSDLQPAERSVVLGLGHPGVHTWTEAAEHVGVNDPSVFGERVRRKVGRLAAEQRRRRQQRVQAPSNLWAPGREAAEVPR